MLTFIIVFQQFCIFVLFILTYYGFINCYVHFPYICFVIAYTRTTTKVFLLYYVYVQTQFYRLPEISLLVLYLIYITCFHVCWNTFLQLLFHFGQQLNFFFQEIGRNNYITVSLLSVVLAFGLLVIGTFCFAVCF